MRFNLACRLDQRWPSLLASFVSVVVVVALVGRAPEVLLRAELWGDDGIHYSAALDRGPTVVLEPFAGYLLLAQRALVYITSLAPPYWVPVISNGLALAALAGVAVYLVRARFPWSRRASIGMALLLPLVPMSRPIIGALSHLQWTAALWLALVAVAAEPTTHRGRIVETTGIALAGLTGPASSILLPLFLLGPRRRLVVVGAAAFVQLALIVTSERAGATIEWAVLPLVVVHRVVVAPLLGTAVAALPEALMLAVGAVVIVGVALAWMQQSRRVALWLAAVALLVPTASLARTEFATASFMEIGWHERYFWMTAVALAWTVVLSRGIPRLVLAALLSVGIVTAFVLPERPYMGWEHRSACIRGPIACTVPVAPEGWGGRWDVRWEP
jgi:hypothetical protein